MPTITFNKFDLGIDHRKAASVSDANRLIEMKNAHVTTGLATEKRPGLKKIATLEPGTKGLFPAFGKLHTFYCDLEPVEHENPLFEAHKILCAEQLTNDETNEITYGPDYRPVTDIHYVDVFNGYLYVSAQHGDIVRHHYLNRDEITQVVDENCPHTSAVIKMASKIFAVSPDGSTVRYSKTGNPVEWTEKDDAGFLPTGLNAQGGRATCALGEYQNNLVALSRDGAQVWVVDPDPTVMRLEDKVENVGTSFPLSLATVAGDLYFLSDYGFRSITTIQLISKLSDVDIGSPIDDIVRPAIRNRKAVPKAVYFYGTGKYLCAIGNQIFVYSISRTSKIAAWSRYELPVSVDAWAELGGVLYIRAGDDVYCMDEDGYSDDGKAFEVVLQLPYMDFKTPGYLKRIYAVDLVMEGESYVSVSMDARYPEDFTAEVRVAGNTRGGGLIPLECNGTEFSFKFRNVTDKPFRLDALSVYYDVLGPL